MQIDRGEMHAGQFAGGRVVVAYDWGDLGNSQSSGMERIDDPRVWSGRFA